MIQSSVWQAAWTEGKAEGKAEEKAEGLRANRDYCLELIRKRHPALLAKATPIVEACEDHTLLLDWILSAGQLDDDALARLLGIG